MNFTPFPEIKTERLLLRKLKGTDANEMFFLRSDENVLRYLGRKPAKTIGEAEEFINKINKNVDENDSVLWGITILNDPSLIVGTICLWNFKPENYSSEIGYLLHPDHWRKGIMKEAVNAVVDYGFNKLGLNRIEALLTPDNSASVYVLERTGFIKEGHLRENFYFNGNFSDTLIYSRLKSDSSSFIA